MDKRPALERTQTFLVLSILATVLLYVVPYGRTIGYPLVLLSTLAHEMGHGLAAVFIGGHFDEFRMWSDGSGVARWLGSDVGRLGKAFVAAGGLVGPAVAAALGFWLARSERRARAGLWIFGVGLLVALVLVVRGAFGMFFVAALAVLCIFLAAKAKPWIGQVAVVFVAVQLALSVFSRGDYLFTDVAQTSAGPMPSDVAQMADALWLPYWFWGALCGAGSVAVLLVGLRAFFRAPATGTAASASTSPAPPAAPGRR